MGLRFALVAAASLAASGPQIALAAEYERSGDWVFHSKAVAEDGDTLVYACVASTASAEGTELALRLEPGPGDAVAATMALHNPDWEFKTAPAHLRLDIGASRWMLPAEGSGDGLSVAWSGDAHLPGFLEELASGREARLVAADGRGVAAFSLTGSRGAISAMKTCLEDQTGQPLDASLPAGDAPF